MSKDVIKFVSEVVRDLEDEVGRLEGSLPGSSFNSEDSFSVPDLLQKKDQAYAAAVANVCEAPCSVKILRNKDIGAELMVKTVTEELEGLQRLRSASIKQENISRLEKFISLEKAGEPVDDDLEALNSVLKQAKKDFNTILSELCPEDKDEIKEVLSRVEEESLDDCSEEDKLRPWSPRLCPMLDLLTSASIIKKSDSNFYVFNFPY